jgi:activator of 2-hydroxyglutaryl-CoA dehydratase
MKNAKIARGCGFGGCGCALVLLIVGGILFAFGMQRATREALPFSYVVLGIMPFVGIVGAALLGWGMVTLNKLKGK